MGGGIAGGLTQIIGTIVTGIKASRDKKRLAADQKVKSKELLNKANSVVTKQAVDDPAYKIKAFLAQSGVPGYEQYLQEIDANTEAQIMAASKGASSGFGEEAYLSSLEGEANAQKRNLGVSNDAFKAGQKKNLANTLYQMQSGFNAQAKSEKEDLNNAATKYEAASTLNKSAANEQIATTVGTAFNQAGDMVSSMTGGGMGGSGNVSMGNLSGMFGKSELNMSGTQSQVQNVTINQQEAQEIATKKGISIQDLVNMGFVIK